MYYMTHVKITLKQTPVYCGLLNADQPFKDEEQTVLFKDPVRTAQ